ncbi:MAG: hypothetical protein COU81_00135 [Candidatus Portnoybacteria bacterium CG10_big_fil_rev_8_21_14_0_10_36_7]|uniref:DUF1573 domain-containing protein n=1 Tax=Candidatus Portnoybacteria bacterium CG10_big_fil_rev_8_21_14_0_10_36_7 TaxID=1974812 RepID=A0A2M8KF42_9BACT|nr:MAG: hypothetical protein COU81_00135 [Candidatus Portnoybacteria bacterium CG10_big_fil_rev_8_21_14_0_10_36_7]
MNNKTLIIIIILIILGFGVLIWWASLNQENNSSVLGTNNSQSVLTASEKVYDFGTISMKDGKVEKVFKVTNSSAQDITISSIVTSCMCTVAYLETADGERGPFGMPGHGLVPKVNETIGAGETREVKVVYDPNAHGPAGVGNIDRFITLTDKTGAKFNLEIKATVTP